MNSSPLRIGAGIFLSYNQLVMVLLKGRTSTKKKQKKGRRGAPVAGQRPLSRICVLAFAPLRNTYESNAAHPRAACFAPILVSIINVLFYRDFLPAPAPPLLLLTLPLEMSHDLFRRPKTRGRRGAPPVAARETLSRTTSSRTKQKNKNGNGYHVDMGGLVFFANHAY